MTTNSPTIYLIFGKVTIRRRHYARSNAFINSFFSDADRQGNRKVVDADLEKITPLLMEFGATEYHIDLILDILLKDQHKLSNCHYISRIFTTLRSVIDVFHFQPIQQLASSSDSCCREERYPPITHWRLLPVFPGEGLVSEFRYGVFYCMFHCSPFTDWFVLRQRSWNGSLQSTIWLTVKIK